MQVVLCEEGGSKTWMKVHWSNSPPSWNTFLKASRSDKLFRGDQTGHGGVLDWKMHESTGRCSMDDPWSGPRRGVRIKISRVKGNCVCFIPPLNKTKYQVEGKIFTPLVVGRITIFWNITLERTGTTTYWLFWLKLAGLKSEPRRLFNRARRKVVIIVIIFPHVYGIRWGGERAGLKACVSFSAGRAGVLTLPAFLGSPACRYISIVLGRIYAKPSSHSKDELQGWFLYVFLAFFLGRLQVRPSHSGASLFEAPDARDNARVWAIGFASIMRHAYAFFRYVINRVTFGAVSICSCWVPLSYFHEA